MNFDRRPPENREYLEIIYSFLTEMNGAVMTQLRSINNLTARLMSELIETQKTLNILINGLKESRDKRYQEEIDQLEAKMQNMSRLIEEKRAARSDPMTTSQEIRSVALEVIENEKKRIRIDWIDVRNKVIPSLIGGLIMILVLYILPWLGRLLVDVFAP